MVILQTALPLAEYLLPHLLLAHLNPAEKSDYLNEPMAAEIAVIFLLPLVPLADFHIVLYSTDGACVGVAFGCQC